MKIFTFFIYSLMKDSMHFVKNYSSMKNIDKSHNEHHSLEVLYWSSDIMMNSNRRFTNDECIIISESCILHDMMDWKYDGEKKDVEDYLLNKHPKEKVEIILKIMDTMSYSKTFINNTVLFPELFDYNDAYHVVREADLLSSYNVARMIEYRLAQEMPDHLLKKDVLEFYENRVARLIDNCLFINKQSIKRASLLNEITRLKLECIHDYAITENNLDFFRIVDFLNLQKIAYRFNDLMEKTK